MKKLLIISAITFGGLVYHTADAQIRIGVNFGFHPRPVIYTQAPAYGDDNDDYYYLPDLGVYYNVTDQCYFYFDGTEWISSAYLPGQYANYDWRDARRFEIRAYQPYLHDDVYRERYNGNSFEGWRGANYDGDRGYANRGYGDDNRGFDNNRFAQREQYSRFNNVEYKHGGGEFENRGYGFNNRQGDQNHEADRGQHHQNEHGGRFGR
jgi:hypothetical protein